MSEFVRICGKSDLPTRGKAKEFVADGSELCVANVDGSILATSNVCPHRQGPLGQGLVEHGKIICPWHGWAFDLKSGCSVHSPQAKVEVFEVKVEGEDVLVRAKE